jgi:hypothetical protein
MGPWARMFIDAFDGVGHQLVSDTVSDLRVEPSLITARVGGRSVTLSAPPIAPGIWAAIEGSVTADRQSEQLAQLLAHTWEEPLVPKAIVRIGSDADVAPVVAAVADAIERDPATLLRWRGYGGDVPADAEAWRGGELPPLPPRARRPPDSVPKRFGASGIVAGGEDVVETLIRAYGTFSED